MKIGTATGRNARVRGNITKKTIDFLPLLCYNINCQGEGKDLSDGLFSQTNECQQNDLKFLKKFQKTP